MFLEIKGIKKHYGEGESPGGSTEWNRHRG